MKKQLLQEIERVREIMGLTPEQPIIIEQFSKLIDDLMAPLTKKISRWMDDVLVLGPSEKIIDGGHTVGHIHFNWSKLPAGVDVSTASRKTLDDFAIAGNKAIDEDTWGRLMTGIPPSVASDPGVLLMNLADAGASRMEKLGAFRVLSTMDSKLDDIVNGVLDNKIMMGDFAQISKIGDGAVAVDDVAEKVFNMKYADLLPNQQLIIRNINSALPKLIKKLGRPTLIRRIGTSIGQTITKKVLRRMAYTLIGGFVGEEIMTRLGWYDPSGDPIGEHEEQVQAIIENSFDIHYWKEARTAWGSTGTKREKWEEKQLLSDTKLGEIYTEMILELDNFDVQEEDVANHWGKGKDIQSVVQSSQFASYYQGKKNKSLLQELADRMSIPLKGAVVNWLVDLFGEDVDVALVIGAVATNPILIPGKGEDEALNEKDIEDAIWDTMPFYPREKYDTSGNVYCCVVQHSRMPVTVVDMMLTWCSANKPKCGQESSLPQSKASKIPVVQLNNIHVTEMNVDAYIILSEGQESCTEVDPKYKVSIKENKDDVKAFAKQILIAINKE